MKKLLAAIAIALMSTSIYAQTADLPVDCFPSDQVFRTLTNKEHKPVFKGVTTAKDGGTITTEVYVGPNGEFALILTNDIVDVTCVVMHGQEEPLLSE